MEFPVFRIFLPGKSQFSFVQWISLCNAASTQMHFPSSRKWRRRHFLLNGVFKVSTKGENIKSEKKQTTKLQKCQQYLKESWWQNQSTVIKDWQKGRSPKPIQQQCSDKDSIISEFRLSDSEVSQTFWLSLFKHFQSPMSSVMYIAVTAVVNFRWCCKIQVCL